MAPQRGDGGSRNHVQRLCIPLCGGGTSLPEIGGGWPDSVCSLAGPSESVLCTIHIPQFLGATMLAFLETIVNTVAGGIHILVDALTDLINY
ncbi:hypothetical protein CVAR_1080 [Corynebacterium variabile DSM 44702]|uniref:Uncharacterized protein n=1 Tax=Corynebacterium variabile (strain DSM 44702 / CIP 107183 / JCM 12073 / NCIMB 30131) TaxID=858619 RepID=G0HDW6_CORVD|nr:hypothetical protein CVAR_1080 [Corynebacterium variabile DSM 44702]